MSLPAAFLSHPIAHRGYHGTRRRDAAAAHPDAPLPPENSLGAARAAIARGYGIELDVQPTADGRVVVFHDDTLERMTGAPGPVRTHSWADLGALRLLGSDEPVPLLETFLEEVAGAVPLLVEIKDQSGTLGPVDGRLEEQVAGALRGYGGPVAVMSFNPHSMAHMARLAPDVPRGLTTCAYDRGWPALDPAQREQLKAIADYARVGASFVSHEWGDLANPRVQALKAAGAAVLCWTVTSPEIEAQARRLADNITFEGYPAAAAQH